MVANGECFIARSMDRRNVEEIYASISQLLPKMGFAGAKIIDPFPESAGEGSLVQSDLGRL